MYVIERAIKNYLDIGGNQVLFEHAVCLSCAQNEQENLSEESRESLRLYFQAMRPKEDEFSGDFNQCLITQKSLENIEEYQVFGMGFGSEMLEMNGFPFALSGEIMEEIAEQLSKETRDYLDGYMTDKFGVPPEFESPLRPVLL